MRTPRFINLVLVLICGFCLILAAQQKQDKSAKAQNNDEQSFKVGTHLVLVPVIVTDKHGEHLTGLKADDFEVKEDGSAQKIVQLDELSADTVKVAAPAASAKTFSNQVAAEHPKKLEIIALDQINTPFASARDGHRALVEFLSKSVDANTLLALVAMEHNGVRIIHNFTSDPSILVEAVKKVQYRLTSRDTRMTDALGDNSEADLEAIQIINILNGTDAASALASAGSGPGAASAALAAAARANIAQQRALADASAQAQDALITLEDFQQIAQYFSGVPGRKSLIWASTGFPFAMGTYAQSNTRGTLFEDWERTFRMLADANVSVYPVDIGGLLPGVNANNLQTINSQAIRTGGGEGGVAARSGQLDTLRAGGFVDPNVGRQDTMRQLADMTGGLASYNSNDGYGLFRRASDDAGQYYVLSYYTKESGKSGWRKLNVKVSRDGAKVRARSGFFFANSASESEGARVAEETMALASDLNFTTLPIEGKWMQIEPAGNDRKVRFLLTVPAGVPFIDADNQLNFDFRVMVFDSKGQIAGKLGQRLQTKLAADEVEKIRNAGLDYMNELTLAPGEYKAHFVIRDNLKGSLGSVVATLKIE